jgi:lysine 2,3-aminomutase
MSDCGVAGSAAAMTRHAVTYRDVDHMLDRYGYCDERRAIIRQENLLPPGLLGRLQATYPQHSGLLEQGRLLFPERDHYTGLDGFREVIGILKQHGILIGEIAERELFVEVYRFKVTRHVLNSINWDNYERDSMFQLVFPQPGMIRREVVDQYIGAGSAEQRRRIVADYIRQTNPHDGHQLLNKPWLETGDGGIEIVEGSQHKYPQCQLVFDKTTQQCFAFCTYCFRHAQVRGDDDMFIQEDIAQIHEYLRAHKEVTDLLITGGDAGYLPVERLRQYVMPIIEDPALLHIRTVRLGSRMLTYEPERVLSRRYDRMLALFDTMSENGVQLSWMAHFSTPRELLNPGTIAAIRRLQRHGAVVRSQSPIMNHISLFKDEDGRVDVERSAKNWVDLANILATLKVHFHSMYCARATGEHHYFTAPLADIEKVSNLIFRSLASINRPSRYITMTTSAGKLSILGVAEVNGEKAFALKFNESRNMEWMDRVFLAKYDERESRVDFLTPFDTSEFFFEDELRQIETALSEMHRRHSPPVWHPAEEKVALTSASPVP